MARHKEFCVEYALSKALEVFWRHGFEGASMNQLTAAMGITKPSLYATYGNKEELFRKALDLYETRYMGFMRDALAASTACKVVKHVLGGFVALATDAQNPRGCMDVNGALACSTAADPIKDELARRRSAFETALAHRLRSAQAEGDLARSEDVADLARFVMTFAVGVSVQAADGASRDTLERAVGVALRAWPAREAVDA